MPIAGSILFPLIDSAPRIQGDYKVYCSIFCSNLSCFLPEMLKALGKHYFKLLKEMTFIYAE